MPAVSGGGGDLFSDEHKDADRNAGTQMHGYSHGFTQRHPIVYMVEFQTRLYTYMRTHGEKERRRGSVCLCVCVSVFNGTGVGL
jgi:hypothetical protein